MSKIPNQVPDHRTPFMEVNSILGVLLSEVQSILGDQFIGLYLYGSLAYGGFDKESDIDFLVVTRNDLTDPIFNRLREMHLRITQIDSWRSSQLEGSYLPQNALRIFDPRSVLFNHIDRGPGETLKRMEVNDGQTSRAWWGGWVMLRAVLLDCGIPLAGPPPAFLVDAVSVEELKQANLAVLHGWFEPMLEDTSQLESYGYQPYAVLTMCRILYTHASGGIVSKPEAARWAQETIGAPWASLIDRAWTGRQHPEIKASNGEIRLTQEFIRFALEHCI